MKALRFLEKGADYDEATAHQNGLLHRMSLGSPLKELIPCGYSRQNTISKTIREFSVQNHETPFIQSARDDQSDLHKPQRAARESKADSTKRLIDFSLTERSTNEFGDGSRYLSNEQIARFKQKLSEPDFPEHGSHQAGDH